MTHPNRSRKAPSKARNPKPAEIRQARLDAGLTTTEAAGHLHMSGGAWEQWEAGERPMHPLFWLRFRIAITRITVGRVAVELDDPDQPRLYKVIGAEDGRTLGMLSGPHDDRFACFYASEVGSPRRPGLEGTYTHQTIEQAIAAFEQVLGA